MTDTLQKPISLGPAGPPPAGRSEGSMVGRLVVLLSPFFVAGASWIASFVAAHVPGVTLDSGQIAAFMVAVATSAITAIWKWLQGWQQHERLVAEGLVVPTKPVVTKAQ